MERFATDILLALVLVFLLFDKISCFGKFD